MTNKKSTPKKKAAKKKPSPYGHKRKPKGRKNTPKGVKKDESLNDYLDSLDRNWYNSEVLGDSS